MNTHPTKFRSIITFPIIVLYMLVIMTGMTEICMCDENCNDVNHYDIAHSNGCSDNNANEDGCVSSIEITSSSPSNDVCSCAVWTATTNPDNDAESFDINPRNHRELSDIRILSETADGLSLAFSQCDFTSTIDSYSNSFASCKTIVLLN